MNVCLINPRWVSLKNDFLGSGIPYWPCSLAAFNWIARQNGDTVNILDLPAMGLNVFQSTNRLLRQGVDVSEVANQINSKTDCIIIYAMSYASKLEINYLINFLRNNFELPILILENSQAVTGFLLNPTIEYNFIDVGATGVLRGNPLDAYNSLVKFVGLDNYSKIALRNVKLHWETFQVKNYNDLPYSHGPKRGKFMPLITSWGCPYGCDFCVVPRTNSRRWVPKDVSTVIQEISSAKSEFGIYDFQVEDLNPTVSWPRWKELCEKLVESNFQITYSLVSGTKAETIPLEEIPLLFDSGCRYISISPESGSPILMKKIGKYFDHRYALDLIRNLNRNRISTQACFLVGHPKETPKDKVLSIMYMLNLLYRGLSEIAVFVVAPYPGTTLMHELAPTDSEIVTFSGHGRKLKFTDKIFKILMILLFAFSYLIPPSKISRSIRNSISNKPETKIENLIPRIRFFNRHRVMK